MKRLALILILLIILFIPSDKIKASGIVKDTGSSEITDETTEDTYNESDVFEFGYYTFKYTDENKDKVIKIVNQFKDSLNGKKNQFDKELNTRGYFKRPIL